MNDLRKAAETALEALDSYPLPFQIPAKEALRQALAQADKQPIDLNALGIPHGTLFQPAQPEQEPVAYVTDSGKSAYILLGVDLEDDTPLYTAPPKREWVPLTDDEYDELLTGDWGGSLIKRVEARLKEKNGG